MGGNKSKQVSDAHQQQLPKNQTIGLKIATAKVGECYSPFEFYHEFKKIEGNVFDEQLNQKFQDICHQYTFVLSDSDECLLRRLSKMTTSRYTPLFNPKAGIKHGKFLLTRQEFEAEWGRVFDEIQEKQGDFLFGSFQPRRKQLRRKLKEFDLICYHALLAQAYNTTKTINEIVRENCNFDYCLLLEQCFDSPLNKVGERIKLIIQYANRNAIDILFLQEISRRSLDILDAYSEHYRITHMENSKRNMCSAIMIRKQLSIDLDPANKKWTLKKHNQQYLDPNLEENTPYQLAEIGIYSTSPQPKQKNLQVALLPSSKKKHAPLPSLKKTAKKMQCVQKNGHRDESKIMLSSEGGLADQDYNIQQKLKQMREAEIIRQARVILEHLSGKEKEQVEFLPQEQKKNKFNRQLIRKQTLGGDSPKRVNRKISEAYDRTNLINVLSNSPIKPQAFAKVALVQNSEKLSVFDLKKLNFGDSTTIQFIGNMILISTHLQDTISQTVSQQIYKVMEGLKILRKKFPHYSIIMGLDIENDLEGIEHPPLDQVELMRGNYSCVPFIGNKVGRFERERSRLGKHAMRKLYRDHGLFTVNSIKSNFQLDREQVNHKWYRCQNYLISTLPLKNQSIQTCKNAPNHPENTLPQEDHPFVNYFVRAEMVHELKLVKHQCDSRKRSWEIKPQKGSLNYPSARDL